MTVGKTAMACSGLACAPKTACTPAQQKSRLSMVSISAPRTSSGMRECVSSFVSNGLSAFTGAFLCVVGRGLSVAHGAGRAIHQPAGDHHRAGLCQRQGVALHQFAGRARQTFGLGQQAVQQLLGQAFMVLLPRFIGRGFALGLLAGGFVRVAGRKGLRSRLPFGGSMAWPLDQNLFLNRS
jgi:hypothetical protein